MMDAGKISMDCLIANLRPKTPPPLWFVTNGQATVGPVTTNLLVRGVLHRRVPNDCLVRERKWTWWRGVETLREVRALRRRQALGETVEIEPTQYRPPALRSRPAERFEIRCRLARDPGEALLFCLAECMEVTGARVGAIHRQRHPFIGLVTSCTKGPGMHGRLGHVLPATDPAIHLAARGALLAEAPRRSVASGVVSERLGRLLSGGGVAVAPVICSGRLYALIELGRPDHPFRRKDIDCIRDLANAAATHLSVVRNRWQLPPGA